jgi:hypothetical protein
VIGVVLDLLVERLAHAVPGVAIDAEEGHRVGLVALEPLPEGGHLSRMARVDARVTFGRREEHGGIAHALPDVLGRRIRAQPAVLLGGAGDSLPIGKA